MSQDNPYQSTQSLTLPPHRNPAAPPTDPNLNQPKPSPMSFLPILHPSSHPHSLPFPDQLQATPHSLSKALNSLQKAFAAFKALQTLQGSTPIETPNPSNTQTLQTPDNPSQSHTHHVLRPRPALLPPGLTRSSDLSTLHRPTDIPITGDLGPQTRPPPFAPTHHRPSTRGGGP